ncbi:MAG: sigma-70 family RNA polymerase sigma factor [Elusimicrobiaceae bacterium]|jgi:RNA polymerase sigma-70 factor (ECF subfamily)
MTDAELVSLAKAGDRDAFGVLVDRYKDPVYGFILSLVRREDIAGDIFQEVFIKVLRNIDRYREEGKFKAWLFMAASNMAMDYYRKEGRLAAMEISLDYETQDDGGSESLHSKIPSGEATPEQYALSYENSDRVKAALKKLSPEQLEVILLKEFSGMTFKEIALTLGEPLGTVLARMSRGLKKLRAELEAENGNA